MSSTLRAVVVLGIVWSLAALAFYEAAAAGEKGKKTASAPVVAAAAKKAAKAKPVPVAPLSPAQEKPKDADLSKEPDFSEGLTLPTDRRAKMALEAAKDFIDEKNWEPACQLLNDILVITKQDLMVRVQRQDGKGRVTAEWVSMRQEANRLLGTLPAEGLEVYQSEYGGKARAALAEAKKLSDPGQLAQVALRYFHTDAGAEAANLLGTYYLDRGDNVAAALCFERLLNRQSADKLTSVTLLKAALAFRRIGDDKGNAERAWNLLVKKIGPAGLRLDEQTVSLTVLRQTLDKAAPANRSVSSYDWEIYGGDPSRTAQGDGGAPFLNDVKWRNDTIDPSGPNSDHPVQPEARAWIQQAVSLAEQHVRPVLPGFFPIAVTVRTEEGLLPLLIYRTYWGMYAADIRTGKIHWDAFSKMGLYNILNEPGKVQVLRNWHQAYVQGGAQNMVFENTLLGTLSSDNNLVYLIDDLAIPPHPMYLQNMAWQPVAAIFGPFVDDVKHNVLQAFGLESGKLVWELGSANDQSDLSESHFLGAPLPLGGKLYVLNEKKSELRLLCLEPMKKGAVVWMQTLANAKESLKDDVFRRLEAVNLAYGEGILVCPTNAGAVFGVDLLTHSIVWARSYRQAPPPSQAMPGMAPWMRMNNGSQRVLGSYWKVTAPVIAEGKVVFTAPDGNSVQCLNLRTGKPVWQANRQSDLYLAGVYNGKVLLVGQSTCRALSLANGKRLWQTPTGLPSGQGVASKNIYYLPLQSTSQSKDPEVCQINIDTGEIIGHAKYRPRTGEKPEVPGNLLFFEGEVLSQGVDHVTAYPQLDIKLAQMTERLKKNPKDPEGLTERAEMELDKGDLAQAVADLRLALANNPPPATLPKTRLKLFETLTELFKRNFNASEKYLAEYEEMCKVPIPPNAKPEEQAALQEEGQRRQANFLCLLAKGREGQGRLLEAFDAYMRFAALSGNNELVTVVDEPTLRIRPDVWAQGRIASMIVKAPPPLRAPLEARIAQQWQAVRSTNDLDALRRFVAVFGAFFELGREARLELAERLMRTPLIAASQQQTAFLEAEMNLLQLRRQPDRQLAGRAVEALARLMIRKSLMEDAAYWYRVLGRDFAQTVIQDGKTGADYFNDLATDKRFLPYLEEPRQAWIGGKTKAKEFHGNFPQTFQSFNFEPAGEILPYFQRHRLSLINQTQLKLIDRFTDKEDFSQNLNVNNLLQYFYQVAGYPHVRFPYHLQGHLVVLPVGHMVYAFDPIDQKLLWSKNLFGSGTPSPNARQVIPDPDGGVEILYQDGFRMRIGPTGPVEASYICLQTRQGLIALDPVSGATLWFRTDIPMRDRVFGDEQHVYLVDVRNGNSVAGVRALRAQDGLSVDVPDFAGLYPHRIRTLGGKLLLSEDNPDVGKTALRLYDIQSGKDIWRKEFSAKARIIHTEEPTLTGVVEPNNDGKVTVFDLRSSKEVLVTRIGPDDPGDPGNLDKVPEDGFHLVQDDDRFYLTVDLPPDPAANRFGAGPWTNLIPGMRSLKVNGRVYAFHRDTGKLNWYADVPNQMLVLDHFRDMPIVLFTSRYNKPVNPALGFGGGMVNAMAIKSIDKRTGKLIYDHEFQNNGNQFYALNINPKAGTIDLVSWNFKLQHYLERNAGATKPKPSPRSKVPVDIKLGAELEKLGAELQLAPAVP